MRRLVIALLGLLTACARHDDIRPRDVPKLARLDETGETVWLTGADGSTIEVSRYREVRLCFASSAGGYVLGRPIRAQEWQGRLWLRSGEYRPIPFDPRNYSGAVLVHSDRGNLPFIIVGSVLLGGVLAMAAIETTNEH